MAAREGGAVVSRAGEKDERGVSGVEHGSN